MKENKQEHNHSTLNLVINDDLFYFILLYFCV